MAEQLVIKEAGVPGAPNSYYSEIINFPATGDEASPPTGEYTLLPYIGFVTVVTLPTGLTLVLRTSESPADFVEILAAAPGMVWSDGSNVFVKNANAPASPPEEVVLFVLAQKP